MSLSKDKLQELLNKHKRELLEKQRAAAEAAGISVSAQEAEALAVKELSAVSHTVQSLVREANTVEVSAGDEWAWNKEQLEAIQLAKSGKSFCLIGAAGTGKTTCEKEIARVLVAESKVPPLSMNTKHLVKGAPGIVFTSFTRRAVRNSRKVVSDDIKQHCITLHKLLEFEPVFYDVVDEATGETRSTMRFEPQRNERNPLPSTLTTIVIDESSMVDTDLFLKLLRALPDVSKVQFIFVGDLHQLPPVYGSAILGFKLLELPVIELTRIYRQAAKSPIISLAHKIKNGEDVPVTAQYVTENEQGKVTIHPWKKPLTDFDATRAASIFLQKLITSGNFNEEDDIVLCPQEKITNLAFGTTEFNRIVAQALGELRKAEVHEIIAGYNKYYYAVGDRLLVGREEAIIRKISKNAKYWGVRPKQASVELDRWGNYKKKIVPTDDGADPLDAYVLELKATSDEKEERKQEASHLIDVELLDSGVEETISTAGEINAAQFSYCLTVHKSQGSEWDRVFFLTHQSHVVMWNRELLYTAITRARKELYCIVEPDRGNKSGTLTKAARSPRIKGDTLAEKAEYFKGKADAYNEKVRALDYVEKSEPTETEHTKQGPVIRETTSKPVIAEVARPPVKLIRLSELVSAQFRHEAEESLADYWTKAKTIWGDKIGVCPRLDYNLQRGRTIGLARLSDSAISLNPLWCIVADEGNQNIWREMIHDTIPHEVAHFVNHRFSNGKAHDGGWVMAAKLLGISNPEAKTSAFPSWAQSWQWAVDAAKLRLEAERSDGTKVDTSEDTETLYDTEV